MAESARLGWSREAEPLHFGGGVGCTSAASPRLPIQAHQQSAVHASFRHLAFCCSQLPPVRVCLLPHLWGFSEPWCLNLARPGAFTHECWQGLQIGSFGNDLFLFTDNRLLNIYQHAVVCDQPLRLFPVSFRGLLPLESAQGSYL